MWVEDEARVITLMGAVFPPLGWFGIAAPELTSSTVEPTGIRHLDPLGG